MTSASPCVIKIALISIKKLCIGNLISGDRSQKNGYPVGVTDEKATKGSSLACQRCSLSLPGSGSMAVLSVRKVIELGS